MNETYRPEIALRPQPVEKVCLSSHAKAGFFV